MFYQDLKDQVMDHLRFTDCYAWLLFHHGFAKRIGKA
jgi:hypothetical protein